MKTTTKIQQYRPTRDSGMVPTDSEGWVEASIVEGLVAVVETLLSIRSNRRDLLDLADTARAVLAAAKGEDR